MIRAAILCVLALALGACVPGDARFGTGPSAIAGQRVAFLSEAICLNNSGRAAQRRAARAIGFPVVTRDGNADIYINPNTLTYLRIGPVPAQSVTVEDGSRIEIAGGNGCSVGSPAVGLRQANRLAGEILAPRLIDGSDTLRAPLGAGVNAAGGAGFFFENLAVTLPLARSTFADPDTGEVIAIDHPVILIVHN